MKERNYIFAVFALCAIMAIAVCGFNVLIDPYGIANTPAIEGLNAYKPLLTSDQRMTKAGKIRESAPKGLILGSSRAERGYDPDHPGWGVQPVFNGAFGNARAYDAMRFLLHFVSVTPVKKVVLGIDFFQFNSHSDSSAVGTLWPESMFSEGDDFGHPIRWVETVGERYFSLEAAAASIDTIKEQARLKRLSGAEWNGLYPQDMLRREFDFNSRETSRLGELNYFLNGHYADFGLATDRADHNSIFHLERMFDFCHKKGVDLIVVINPAHARQWEMLRIKGLWDQFEEWKRLITQINESSAARFKRAPFKVWDFSGNNAFSNEHFPDKIKVKASFYKFEGSQERTGEFPHIIESGVNGPVLMQAYSLGTANEGVGGINSWGRMPLTWRIYGYSEEGKWVLLDERWDQPAWHSNETRYFPLSKPMKVSKLKLEVARSASPGVTRIHSLEAVVCDTPGCSIRSFLSNNSGGTVMKWFFDTSHFRKELGDLVLDRVFGIVNPERPLPPDFGTLLTSANIEDHLSALRQAEQAYRASHANDISDLNQMNMSGRLEEPPLALGKR